VLNVRFPMFGQPESIDAIHSTDGCRVCRLLDYTSSGIGCVTHAPAG
jgi:hypothetical protein